MTDARAALLADLEQISVSAGQGGFVDRVIDYATLLTKWNAKIRLVGPSDLHTIIREQVIDALGFVPAIEATDSDAYFDVGSGGGLPGIPLALRFPDRRFVLIEPIHKKTSFLQHAVQAFGLTNVQVHTGRVNPNGAIVPALRFRDDRPTAAFSRATLIPEAWLETATELVGPNGLVFITAVDHLPAAIDNDPATTEIARWRWTVPATSAPRLLVLRKVRAAI